MGVCGRSRIGTKAGIRSEKWSVIMDLLCFTLVETRRARAILAVYSLRMREALAMGLISNLPLVDRGWMAGTGRGAPGVAGPAVPSGWARESEVSCE